MPLSRTQCQNIKGWAITLIVIHNYVDHLMKLYCNEMAYSQENTDAFLNIGFTPVAVWQIFAFMGWIGVALFLFLSGYGLTCKYGSRQINTVSYLKSHVTKLLWLLVPVYLLYFLIYHYGFGHEHNWQSVLAQLTFTINFLDYGNNSFLTEPGVYWFFGAILQFYLSFLVIRKLNDYWLWVIAIAGLAVNYLALYTASDDTMWWIRQNAIGWIAPFIMGMLAARGKLTLSCRDCAVLCPLSMAILVVCMTIKPLTPLTEVFTVLFIVSLTCVFTWRPMIWLGTISASLFVIHPFVRMLCYNIMPHFSFPSNQTVALYEMVAVYLIAVVLLGWFHHLLLRKASSRQ